MKSMFMVAPFGRWGLGHYQAPRFLGQDQGAAPTGFSPPAPTSSSSGPLDDVSQGIESLLKEVPAQDLGTYQTQYQHCQDLLNKGGVTGLATGGQCLYDLYEKLKSVVKGKTPTPAKPSPIPYLAPQSSFPIVPVVLLVIGGVAVIYGVSKMG